MQAVAPFTVKTGTAAAYVTTPEDPDINEPTIDYVAGFVPNATGKHFNPHVTVGVATQDYLKEMLAEPFRGVHVFASGGVSLPTRQLRNGAETTQDVGLEAMKPISRRSVIASLAGLAVTFGLLLPIAASAQSDPLPSWNDGAAKQAIVNFVKATTDQSNPDFVPPEERIATFDQDGTLWVEHPMYTQVEYCLERVPALVKAKPELANVEPFKTVMSGDREAMAKLSTADLEKILYATLTGMTVDDFRAEVEKWYRNGQRRALEAALHRTHLPAYAGGDEKLLLNDNDAGKPEGIHL